MCGHYFITCARTGFSLKKMKWVGRKSNGDAIMMKKVVIMCNDGDSGK